MDNPQSKSGGESSPHSSGQQKGRQALSSFKDSPCSTPPFNGVVPLPLTSTGLFSPPTSLPIVGLPNHPPFSPVRCGTGTPESVNSIEWDTFTHTPTFNLDRNFWESRNKSETDHEILSSGSVGTLDSPYRIPIVDTVSSDLETDSSTMTVEDAEKDKSFPAAAQRNLEFDQLLGGIESDRKKLGVLMKFSRTQ